MKVQAILTEVRKDGMQKWERLELAKSDYTRYIWLAPFQSTSGVKVGSVADLVFYKGTGGAIGGHWSGWRVEKNNVKSS
jgi:hypothetical protein